MSTLLVSLLVLAGFLLLVVELLLVPGVGVPGFAGLAALVAACYFAFTRFGTLTGVVVTSCVSLALLALVIYVLRAKTWKRFALRDEIRATALAEDPLPETGTRGVTLTRTGQSLLEIMKKIEETEELLRQTARASGMKEFPIALNIPAHKLYAKRIIVIEWRLGR